MCMCVRACVRACVYVCVCVCCCDCYLFLAFVVHPAQMFNSFVIDK